MAKSSRKMLEEGPFTRPKLEIDKGKEIEKPGLASDSEEEGKADEEEEAELGPHSGFA